MAAGNLDAERSGWARPQRHRPAVHHVRWRQGATVAVAEPPASRSSPCHTRRALTSISCIAPRSAFEVSAIAAYAPLMGTGDKGKDTKELAAAELDQRATAMAQRLRNIAIRGQPAFDRFAARVASKTKPIPEERIVQPPATIEAPAAVQCVLLGEGDEVADLREMFENLLVASMDRSTAAGAHPAFVSMISQLTPDEARILKSVEQPRYPLFWVRTAEQNETISHGIRSLLGVDLGIDSGRFQQYISNLERLGILRISEESMLVIEPYNQLAQLIKTEFAWNETELNNARLERGTVEVTPFGRQFLDTCVRSRER